MHFSSWVYAQRRLLEGGFADEADVDDAGVATEADADRGSGVWDSDRRALITYWAKLGASS